MHQLDNRLSHRAPFAQVALSQSRERTSDPRLNRDLAAIDEHVARGEWCELAIMARAAARRCHYLRYALKESRP